MTAATMGKGEGRGHRMRNQRRPRSQSRADDATTVATDSSMMEKEDGVARRPRRTDLVDALTHGHQC